jgi:hypothetical protein
MPNATLSREEVTADKHRKAAERAEAQAALPADFGPPVAAVALPSCPPVAPEGVVKPRRLADVAEGLSADCLTPGNAS